MTCQTAALPRSAGRTPWIQRLRTVLVLLLIAGCAEKQLFQLLNGPGIAKRWDAREKALKGSNSKVHSMAHMIIYCNTRFLVCILSCKLWVDMGWSNLTEPPRSMTQLLFLNQYYTKSVTRAGHLYSGSDANDQNVQACLEFRVK